MKQTISAIIIVIVVVAGFVYLNNSSSNQSDQSELFRDELNRAGVEKGGQPIEGFSAPMFLQVFPGFVKEDFDGVESYEGVYNLKDGELVYKRTASQPITSAEDVISDEGYATLLKNLTERLDVEAYNQTDMEFILRLLTEGGPVRNPYINDDFSLWYGEGWYPHENNNSVFFSHDEELDIPANTDGFAAGPFFQVSVLKLDTESGEAMTLDDYFAQNLWTEDSEFLVSKKEVIINGLKLTRVITVAAGADGEVLHYVFYDEPERIMTLSQYPYDKNSQDSRDFEDVVGGFMPNFIGDGPDRSGILPFDSGVMGKVLLGPICPVQRDPPDPNCADKGFRTTVQVRYIDPTRSSLFSSVETDKEGNFKVMLPPGEYRLQALGGKPFPTCGGQDITIESDMMLEVDLSCDTGIR